MAQLQISFAVLLLLLLAVDALPQDDQVGRWFFGLSGGGLKIAQSNPGNSSIEPTVALSAGYAFSNKLSLALEFATGRNRVHIPAETQDTSANTYHFKTNLLPIQAQLRYNFGVQGKAAPILSLGAGGVLWETYTLKNSEALGVPAGVKLRSQFSPALSVGFGLDFRLAEKFALTTSVRYTRLLKGADDRAIAGLQNFSGHPGQDLIEMKVGLKVFFGGNPDKDDDGLTNKEEKGYGTDPRRSDTDLDGISDFQEIAIYHTDPLSKDTDNDLIEDLTEINDYGTDPRVADSDGDGLDDGKEIKFYKTDPLKQDSDRDGLKDGEEVNIHKTSPLKADTDEDGLSDGDEVRLHGSNPLVKDSDGDTLTDYEEVHRYGTNPAHRDSDVGGVADAIEIARGTDPLDPNDDTAAEVIEPGPRIIEGIEFKINTAEISAESEPILQTVLLTFLRHPNLHVIIRGYANDGSHAAYNYDLSRRRAETVKRYLVERGVEPERIKAVGVGPARPLASNHGESNGQPNRRIEFVVVE